VSRAVDTQQPAAGRPLHLHALTLGTSPPLPPTLHPDQDALTDASEITRSEREADGVKFYQYDIDSPVRRAAGVQHACQTWTPLGAGRPPPSFSCPRPPPPPPRCFLIPAPLTKLPPTQPPQEFRYLASIAVKDGKVFALFVRSPARIFAKSEASLRHIIDTFFLL
jgi:hypothetical protein